MSINRIIVLSLIGFTIILILLIGTSFIKVMDINAGPLTYKSWYFITSSLLYGQNIRQICLLKLGGSLSIKFYCLTKS